MNNETWTDWLIQCDMLQDSTSFGALDWLYIRITMQSTYAGINGSRCGSRRRSRLCSWANTKGRDYMHGKIESTTFVRNINIRHLLSHCQAISYNSAFSHTRSRMNNDE